MRRESAGPNSFQPREPSYYSGTGSKRTRNLLDNRGIGEISVTRIFPLSAALLLACAITSAQSSSNPAPASSGAPAAAHPLAALSKDHHDGLTISVDPYADAQRAKDKFGKSANPVTVGILPVEVFLTNELPHPLRINMETVELEVQLESGKQDLDWLPVRQVATLIIHPGGNPSSPSARRFPIGIPLPGKDKKVDSVAADLGPFALDSGLVPPLGKIHGFLFFNMNRNFEAASESSLYVPDIVVLPDKTPLMFFEVPLTTGAAPPQP
jgi:hypothetical protein